MIKVPPDWLPHMHDRRSYWFWTPPEWSIAPPVSDGACFALRSIQDSVLLELYVLGIPAKQPDPAGLIEGIMKKSLEEGHDLKIIHSGTYRPDLVDGPDALSRMAAFGLMGSYGFVVEMLPAVDGRRLTVEYTESVLEAKTTTDCFFLHRGDMVLQLNLKTLSSNYQKQARVFEEVAASAKLGKFA
jgi:hypothetical protein